MIVSTRDNNETARDFAFRVIKDNIVSLDLPPGCMVSEVELAFELGLSRTPVREALMELKKNNIVEIYPQRGTTVSLINWVLVGESRFIRLVLEKAMIELICDSVEPVDLIVLEENVRRQEFYLDNLSSKNIFDLDNEFHYLLFKIAKKEYSYKFLSEMSVHFDRIRNLSLSSVRDVKIVSDHRDLFEAIKLKDKAIAIEIITKHLSRYQIDEAQLRREYPQYFVEQ